METIKYNNMEEDLLDLFPVIPGSSATISPPTYGYIINDTNIVIITKFNVSFDYIVGYNYLLFSIQNIDLNTKEITKGLSYEFNDNGINVISKEVYYKIEKLMNFLSLVKDNNVGFDSTINSIIAALTTS